VSRAAQGTSMLGPLDYFLWITSFLLEAWVVFQVISSRSFARYYPVALYMFSAALVECVHYVCITRFGVSSPQYHFVYFCTGTLLTILLFWVIIQFYQQAFSGLNIRRYIRGGAAILILATALFSCVAVRAHNGRLTQQFAVEFGQDLYFVGVVLTYLLWAVILYFRETRARLVHLVLALGVYFSGTAASYALRNLFPSLHTSFQWALPILGTLLPLAWACTFWKVPEDSRILAYQLAGRTP